MIRAEVAKELGIFLRTRRERAEQLAASSNFRRTRGLRREEVAERACISREYYTKLEQGRALNPSQGVLQGIGDALLLSDDERQYLRDLGALLAVGATDSAGSADPVDGVGSRMVDAIRDRPALVVDFRRNVTVWNSMAVELLVDFGGLPVAQRNLTWLMFLNREFIGLCADWEEVARLNVAMLRANAGKHPDDDQLSLLVDELSGRSKRFGEYWRSNDVLIGRFGTRAVNHPEVGYFVTHYDAILLPGPPERHLLVYSASDSNAEKALRRLRANCGELRPGELG